MKIDHKYKYEVQKNADNSISYITNMISAGQSILEIGAGPGSLTKHLIQIPDTDVTAAEIDQDAIEILKNYCNKIHKIDLNLPHWGNSFNQEKYDVVIAADVLEHLASPEKAILEMKNLLKENGSILISLPHIGHNGIIASLFNQDFAYADSGLLDRTHIKFFCIKNMQDLITSAGLCIVDYKFVQREPEDTEFASAWKSLPKELQLQLKTNVFGNVYQCVIKAELNNPAKKSLNLVTSQPDNLEISLARKLSRYAKHYLPKSIFSQLRELYLKISK
ncbi:class I SAM-dependent methyltransferase [Methylophilus flavus]|uniref:Class I SAM-dependent methyltransferase n=1 Tax=Methylophilus flavus TaxID=640084 RepID=A0ABW3P9K1_9PROT